MLISRGLVSINISVTDFKTAEVIRSEEIERKRSIMLAGATRGAHLSTVTINPSVDLKIDTLGVGSVLCSQLALTKSNFEFDMVAEAPTTIHLLTMDFI